MEKEQEYIAPTTSSARENRQSDVCLDLTRTLDEINQDIIRQVLAECGGNQSAAAKRLGISRTTLWRLLK